jgi:hypothetical protein
MPTIQINADEVKRINAHVAKLRPVYIWFSQGSRDKIIAARIVGKRKLKLEVKVLGCGDSWRKIYPEHNTRIEFGK